MDTILTTADVRRGDRVTITLLEGGITLEGGRRLEGGSTLEGKVSDLSADINTGQLLAIIMNCHGETFYLSLSGDEGDRYTGRLLTGPNAHNRPRMEGIRARFEIG